MAQADAEQRHTPDQLPRNRNCRLEPRRVTRAVGEHPAVGATSQDPLEVAVVRQHLDVNAARSQRSQRVALDAVVDDDDSQTRPLTQPPAGQRGIEGFHDVSESFRDLADQILFFERGDAMDALAQRCELATRSDDASLRAGSSQVPGQAAAVAAGEYGNAVAVKPLGE